MAIGIQHQRRTMRAESTRLPSIDPRRLIRDIDRVGSIGRDPSTGGVTRVAFTEADNRARRCVGALMRNAGLRVRTDAAGNLIGESPRAARAPHVVLGSHLDTVPGGGMLDGAYGVLAAVEVARTLGTLDRDEDRYPVVVIAFANEEGAYGVPMWGSRALVGSLDSTTVRSAVDGCHGLGEAVAASGGDLARVPDAERSWDRAVGVVELHVEQGPELEGSDTDAGVVSGIVGRRIVDVEISGATNHAGTTPMSERQDALAYAAELVLSVRELAGGSGGVRTATVGRLEVHPNVVNVIAGRACLEVDLRDLRDDRLDRAEEELAARAKRLGAEHGISVQLDRTGRVAPVTLDPGVRDAITGACADSGASYRSMPSGAGHDAQILAPEVSTGMIFVPSVGGVSHAPQERTHRRHLVLGTEILLRTVVTMHLNRRKGAVR